MKLRLKFQGQNDWRFRYSAQALVALAETGGMAADGQL